MECRWAVCTGGMPVSIAGVDIACPRGQTLRSQGPPKLLESLFERIETEFRLRPTMENIFKMDHPGSSLPKGAGYFSTRAFSSQLADIDSQAL